MDIVQSFYDRLASRYDRLFSDWQAAAEEQAGIRPSGWRPADIV